MNQIVLSEDQLAALVGHHIIIFHAVRRIIRNLYYALSTVETLTLDPLPSSSWVMSACSCLQLVISIPEVFHLETDLRLSFIDLSSYKIRNGSNSDRFVIYLCEKNGKEKI